MNEGVKELMNAWAQRLIVLRRTADQLNITTSRLSLKLLSPLPLILLTPQGVLTHTCRAAALNESTWYPQVCRAERKIGNQHC